MYKKRNWSKIKIILGLSLCALSIFIAPVTSITTHAATVTDIETCADIKEWVYNIVDGKLYKRLYNRSTGEWEGDWIYVCDYPEGAA